MKTEIVKLSQVKVNDTNPRIITDDRFNKLIDSILVLPKMLELRPIVVDDVLVALGGNMRYRGLSAISQMTTDEIEQRLAKLRDFNKKTEAERESLISYWKKWIKAPSVPILKASNLSEDECKEFVIKDNIGYGEWDMDILSTEWDKEALSDWGLDLWEDEAIGEFNMGEMEQGGTLNERFVVPPFSILDTRKGYWQKRKKMWRGLIGDMGETRNDALISSVELKYKDLYQHFPKIEFTEEEINSFEEE